MDREKLFAQFRKDLEGKTLDDIAFLLVELTIAIDTLMADLLRSSGAVTPPELPVIEA